MRSGCVRSVQGLTATVAGVCSSLAFAAIENVIERELIVGECLIEDVRHLGMLDQYFSVRPLYNAILSESSHRFFFLISNLNLFEI